MFKTSSVSIIIPTYNGKHLLSKHLPAVMEAALKAEVIVVDDASTDGTVDWLEINYPQIRVVRHQTNRRFAAACNSGVRAAKGDLVMLLNNDVSPHKNFLKPLIKHFNDPKVFGVGCAEYDEDQASGRSGGDYQRGFYIHWRARQQISGPTLWVSGGSGILRKSMWEELEGMDESFRPAYQEDRDICYRALKRGYKLNFEADSKVIHKHETTNSRVLGRWKMEAASYKNQFLMVWKNITSTKLMMKHVAWLPYHLTLTTYRSKGLCLIGFTWAIRYLPTILDKRRKEQSESRVSDEAIIEKYKEI